MKKIIALLVLGCALLASAAPVAAGSGCGHCRNCRNCYCTANEC
jgi:hypothetical protein